MSQRAGSRRPTMGWCYSRLLSVLKQADLSSRTQPLLNYSSMGLAPLSVLSTLNMDIKLTILRAYPTNYEIYVGDSNPSGTIYYIRLASNADVYTVINPV